MKTENNIQKVMSGSLLLQVKAQLLILKKVYRQNLKKSFFKSCNIL
jgi:hypothetical protein